MSEKFKIRLVCIIFIVLCFSMLGGTMRESDQASFVRGAYELAKGGDPEKLDLYMLDKSYLAHYLYSLPARVFLMVRESFSLEISDLILWTNTFQALFLAGCLCVFVKRGSFFNGSWMIMLCCLLSPVLLFSVPFLACSVLAFGFLLLLASVYKGEEEASTKQSLVCWSLAFCAVACRVDSVLVLPALVLLGGRGASLRRLFSKGSLAIGLGGLSAILVGKVLFPISAGLSLPYFNMKIWSGYVIFGWSIGGLLFLLMLWHLLYSSITGKKLTNVLLIIAISIPVVFYSFYLFSPRYFILPIAVMMFSLTGKGGQRIWQEIMVSKLRKPLILCVCLLPCTWFFGVTADKGLSKAELACSGGCSLFPTADGMWSMGGYAHFLGRLACADSTPLDHNQRIWSAWTTVDTVYMESLENESVGLDGLFSYGQLRFSYEGLSEKLVAKDKKQQAGYTLLDSRRLLRGRSPFRNVDTRDYNGSEVNGISVISSDKGSDILARDNYGNRLGDSSSQVINQLKEIRKLSGGLLGYYRWAHDEGSQLPKGHKLVIFTKDPAEARKKLGLADVVATEHDNLVGIYRTEDINDVSLLEGMRVYISEYMTAFSMKNL